MKTAGNFLLITSIQCTDDIQFTTLFRQVVVYTDTKTN